jgi:parallel beta-helix repeat protein
MEGSTTHTTYVEAGTYYISAALALTAADSGFTFVASPGQAPVLDGGASGLSTLVSMTGATNVTLSGLTFANTGTGGAAIAMTNSSGATISGNHFLNNGTAIWLNNSSNNIISGNQIDNAVKNGVEVFDNSNFNVIDSNLINGVASPYTSGAGVFLHGASNNTISHNVVENTAGVGIGILNWDNATINLNNIVSYNRVMNTGTATPYDTGAIYILGRSQLDTGTVVDHNYIYKAGAPGDAHSVAIYLDDYTSGVAVTNNIIVDPGSYGIQTHGGNNLTIQNNIFDLGANSQAIGLIQGLGANVYPHNVAFTQNIVYSEAASQNLWDWFELASYPTNANNLYWDIVGGPMTNSSPFPDTSPKFGDPKFADEAAGNFAPGAGSAAGAIGFQAIDQSGMGLHPLTVHWYP